MSIKGDHLMETKVENELPALHKQAFDGGLGAEDLVSRLDEGGPIRFALALSWTTISVKLVSQQELLLSVNSRLLSAPK